ncbi:polysaccharide deacetylase family protein [Sporomusa sp.]|uniref:polysaccharide deacetylase family protein n=1 Tax=Sporomusa sp. TaxID=2078658 RepID=UPI002BDC010C|nr:polysaccharide deacetylase family protein [Sporomusa sp.]HWR45747.1 polysaccharide deacetylase family protein [Sporomusa sp.]
MPRQAGELLTLKKKVIGLILIGLMLFSGLVASADFEAGIPVLLYHHVGNDDGGLPRLTVTADEFERQMLLFHQAGFETISPEQLVAYMKGEEVSLPEKPIMFTFDDGYDDNYSYALPILKKYGFKAVFFVVGTNVDSNRRLSAQQLREIAQSGFSVSGHSMTHRDLTKLTEAELRNEIYGNKRQLEQITHREAVLFSYPYGYYNLPVWEAVEASGYQGAFTVLSGLNKPSRDNIFLLRRIPIFNTTDFDTLFRRLNKNQTKSNLLDYLPEVMDSSIYY